MEGAGMTALPHSAARRLERLEQDALDQQAHARAMQDAIERLHIDEANAMRRRKATRQDDPAALGVVDGEIADIRKRLDQAQAESLRRRDAASIATRTLTQTMAWLKALPYGAVLEAVDFEPVTPRKGMSAGDIVLDLRRQIMDAQRELAHLRDAVPTRDELVEAVTRHVENLARDGKPRLSAIGGLSVEWPRALPHQFAAWFAGDVLVERLLADLGDIAGKVSEADRGARTRELRRQLAALEYSEEAAVCLALESGVNVHRRPDASPQCVLGVRISKAARKAAA